MERNRPGRAVSLLSHDQLSLVMDVFVFRMIVLLPVNQENDVRVLADPLHLGQHRLGNPLISSGLQAPGIHQEHVPALDAGRSRDAVSRHARAVVDQGTPHTQQAVEKPRLTNVRASHQGHQGQSGSATFPHA